MTHTSNIDSATELRRLSRKLKSLRESRDWTLDELAERTGLSKPYLSRLEAGERQPSIAALLSIAQTYSVTVAALFQEEQQAPQVVVRQGQRPLKTGNGLFHTSLSERGGEFNLRPIRVIVPVDRAGGDLYQHDGEEWLYVLSGHLRLILGNEQHLLSEGDAAHFDARTPHRLVAEGETDAELLLVATVAPRPLLGSYL
ncbi:cupin domain-containing protein [Deinococcus sp. HMF7620]|uniref:Cupin domain-containing protein n=1 Tax=Deinococcus arboris TaxID=2682977 RepID=A0A7C9LNQ2_9DEIO|nr:cupin domain-containing protein [Deinococcus arboris]